MRDLKKGIKGFSDDPMGVVEQFDQFVGLNIFMWDEMDTIMKILFSPEERQIIRVAGMRIWERENPQGPPGEHKMPLTPLSPIGP